jgi:hypothetical protein
MPDLGNRASALGPQPIEKPLAPPPAMFAAARHILDLLAAVRREASKRGELEALAMPKALDDLRELIEAVGRNTYERHEIVAHAKVNAHYYVKGRLLGQGAEPFTLQMRLGGHQGRWMIWEVANLSGGRTAWTR